MNWSPTAVTTETQAGKQLMHSVFGNAWQPASASRRIEAGLPFTALASFISGQDADAVLKALRISKRTYDRRREQGRLLPAESDRLYRLVQLYGLAADVMGNEDAGKAWMTTPARALAGRTPLDTVRNEAGARQVEDLLLRIEYGVYG